MVMRAVVRNGRVHLDEPTDLPEGSEIDLVPSADSGDDLDDEEREALNARLQHSVTQARRGEVRPAEEILATLNARR